MSKIEIAAENDCPCCSDNRYIDCCYAILTNQRIAATPLELMRSRYTAHVVHDMQHIKRTMQGKALKLFDEEKTDEEWFLQTQWRKLEIVFASPIAKQTKEGIVEFKAHYVLNGAEQILHERSKFHKIANQWYYVAGQQKNANIQHSDKIGRNEICGCGSGKKFKKCCAGAK